MKHGSALLIFLALTACSAPQQRDTPSPQPLTTKQSINQTIDAWHKAAEQGDFNAYVARMTFDAVFIGTDATERWAGPDFRAFARPYFDGQNAWTYQPQSRQITLAEDNKTAWFDEILQSPTYGTSRGIGVLIQESDGQWRIAHYALSFPIPNPLAADITTLIKSHEATTSGTTNNPETP